MKRLQEKIDEKLLLKNVLLRNLSKRYDMRIFAIWCLIKLNISILIENKVFVFICEIDFYQFVWNKEINLYKMHKTILK